MSDEHTTVPDAEAPEPVEAPLVVPEAVPAASPEAPEMPPPAPPVPEPQPVPPAPPAPPAPSTAVSHKGRAAIWWGVALVIVGGALMVSQFVPGVELWRYWPLIIIAFGVRGMFGPAGGPWSIKNLAEGLSTIAFGLVFLGQMLGYLSWGVWLNILQLWPLLLVALGLEIAGKGLKSDWVRALGNIVIIAGLAYGALVMAPGGGWPLSFVPAGETQPFDLVAEADPDVDEGFARVEGGVGTLSVEAGGDLATAEGRSPYDPVFDVDADGRDADVRIGLGGDSWGPTDTDAELNVTLSEDVVWDLEIEAGVTRYEADLSGLVLSELMFDAGVSDGTLTLGPSDAGGADWPVPVQIESGVSSLTIRVPKGDNVRVSVSEGLTSTDTRGEWAASDDGDRRVYTSDGFSDSAAYWDVEIEAGVSGIIVEYY